MSPLVDRGLVIVHVGGHGKGALTAFDANTGDVWCWTGDGPSYASPIVADIEGVRQVITLSQENIIGVSESDGRLLWQRPFSTDTQNIITPLLSGSTLIVSGYQKPTTALRIVKKGEQWMTEVVWENPAASLYMADAVVVGDKLFALSHRNRGQYMLLDLKTGKTLWTGDAASGRERGDRERGDLSFRSRRMPSLWLGVERNELSGAEAIQGG